LESGLAGSKATSSFLVEDIVTTPADGNTYLNATTPATFKLLKLEKQCKLHPLVGESHIAFAKVKLFSIGKHQFLP
jgi:hypothetical protein